ncbi:MAG TPA: hypothetical protein VK837_01415 [Longimicrobiales bacterium]|nr:hypothetical protein [Longimicrobiales bacterium]
MNGRKLLLALVMAATPTAVSAQSTEVGMASGLSVFTAEGDDLTIFGLPGDGLFLPTANVYATFFATPQLAIEPHLGVVVVNGSGDTEWVGRLGTQLGYYFSGGEDSSPYVAANGAWIRDGDEDNSFSLGAAVGYRVLLPPGLAVRFEAGYARWFIGGGDEFFDPVDLNQFRLGIGIGGLVN